MDSIDEFLKGKPVISSISEKNIQSAWCFIAGGLKAHESKGFINKYGLIHILRQIDGYFAFPPTKKLREVLKDFSIDCPDYWLSKDRVKYNSLLKNHGHQDKIQIEHLNGGVKQLVEKMAQTKLSGDLEQDIVVLKNLHLNTTRCCYKLISEIELNEASHTSRDNLHDFF